MQIAQETKSVLLALFFPTCQLSIKKPFLWFQTKLQRGTALAILNATAIGHFIQARDADMSSFDAARCLQYGLIRFGFICNQKTSNMITGSSDLRKLWNTWPNFNRITRITDYLIISQSHSHSAAATLSISSFHFASLGRFRTLRLG